MPAKKKEMPQCENNYEKMRIMRQRGFSPVAIAITFGGSVGSDGYYKVLDTLGAIRGVCGNCGAVCMGTGDCNCKEE